MERRQFLLKVFGASAAAAAAIAATQAHAASQLLEGTTLARPDGIQLAQSSPTPSGNPDQSGATPGNGGAGGRNGTMTPGPAGSNPGMARSRRPMRRKMRRRMRRRRANSTM